MSTRINLQAVNHAITHDHGGDDEIVRYVMSSNVFHSSDTEKSYTGSIYTKVKEITLSILPSSTLRIHFGLRGANPGNFYYGCIYRNGVVVGTPHVIGTADATKTTFDEDISGWSDGDLLQIYCMCSNNTFATYIDELRILGYDGSVIVNNDP